MHMKWIARAKTAGARLVVFPELSLTGYYLKDLAADVACAADDPQLLPIAEASRELDISAGFVERSADAKLHIAQGHWSGGKLVHIHRKVYLPTYGIFDDGRYFAPDGTVAARAPEFDEDLLIGEIDPELVARERARNPLLRDEREDIVLRNIAGRLGLPFDRRD